ncbi:MAG: hypothetical protein GF401_15680 [Chitinivibrionales bacterium]|nr:hypothetical protein [Chitinivibrionales bacterium]
MSTTPRQKTGVSPEPRSKSLELLAPAGSLESFHAAIDAGADAVYVGLGEFNARLRAKNFTSKTLSFCVPYAKSRNVKIYVTLNTLVKQHELEQAVHVLFQLQQLRVDGIIVQDLGLIRIARGYFPTLKLHASTQMAIHNSGGLDTAQRIGIRRVILSRELTFEEIQTMRKKTSLELELFVHGALCYSISGMCLASSYLGGMSGNRGRCTQVCRRKFSSGDNEGFFFSPDDLSAIDFIPKFKDIGINSLKIEGRMKGPEYLHTVVSAYRRAIDTPEKIPELKQDLVYDFGREKTSLFLSGVKNEGIIQSLSISGTGILLGEIVTKTDTTLTIKSSERLSAGDRIRIHPKSGYEGKSVKVAEVNEGEQEEQILTVPETASFHKGDSVYLVSRKKDKAQFEKRKIDVRPYRFRPYCPFSRKIMREYTEKKGEKPRRAPHKLFIKVDSLAWLFQLQDVRCDGIIATLDREDMMKLYVNSSLLQRIKNRLILSLPPFIKQGDFSKWSKIARIFNEKGLSRWFAGNIGELPIFEKKPAITADYHIWCLNRAAQAMIHELEFDGFTYSLEDDILNLKATGNPRGFACLFAYVPLFISRIKPLLDQGDKITDSTSEEFFLAQKHNLYYLVGQKPFGITHKRDRLGDLGVHNFIIDLSFCECKKKILREVLTSYNKKEKVPGSVLFNYKAGLK